MLEAGRPPVPLRYDVGVENVTAFVLAGGRSSRMGQDKALLPLRDQTLLDRALAIARTVSSKVVIVGPRERYAQYGEVIEDLYKGCGPLAGIHAALSASQTELNLVVSVDMPRMSPGFLQWLVNQARSTRELIVVPYALSGQQPLAAVYSRSLQPFVEKALQDGDYKIEHLFDRVPTRYIAEGEVRSAGFSLEIFSNVNTTADYQALVRADAVALDTAKATESGR